jgi:quinoprotein glucose dehydrogenase
LSGDPGGKLFRAYNKATGDVVAEIELPEKSSGAPMTYMHKGKQYIVIAVATRQHAAELVALALPENGQRRKQPVVPKNESAITAAVAASSVSTGDTNNGRRVFSSACAMCHGQRGEGMDGGAPPLTNQTDVEKVLRIVSQGGVNMPPMQTMLTAEQIRDVSAFVVENLRPR